jgi:hypothetical protein
MVNPDLHGLSIEADRMTGRVAALSGSTGHPSSASKSTSARLKARLIKFAVVGVLSAVAGRPVWGAEEARTCRSAYDKAQDLERSSRLIEAKESLQSCARPRCGRRLQQVCAAKFSLIESDIPSVVLLVTDGTGAPRVDVGVKMDGAPLATEIDGRALPVDPGLHEFSFSTIDGVFATRKVLVGQGQRNRPIEVSSDAPRK